MVYFSQWGCIFIMWQPDTVSINVWMDVSHVGLRGVFEYEVAMIVCTSDDRVH